MMDNQTIQTMVAQLRIQPEQIKHTLSLLEQGNTVPFIARYRKEMTRGLDEEQIRSIQEVYGYEMKLQKRKQEVMRLIETKGKLTEEIKAAIVSCQKLSEVEDLYRPYQQKRKTRASSAIAAGLEPLADWMMKHADGDLRQEAKRYVNESVSTIEEAIQGAKDIVAERVSDDAGLRKRVRDAMLRGGMMKTEAKKKHDDTEQVYRMYYAYQERLSSLAPHRMMAIDRAEREGVIKVTVSFDQEAQIEAAKRRMRGKRAGMVVQQIDEAVEDGMKRLLIPSVEHEVRSELLHEAQEASIGVFSMNLEKLLLQAPMKNRMILGLDPAYRTGCKLAVIDTNGKLLAIDVIYPHPPVNRRKEAEQTLLKLLKQYPIEIIAIGNGTASRESEQLVAEVIQKHGLHVSYTMVSEAGASVYSASPLAKQEFPHLQVEQRSAVSIARRIMDPLAELIKIDPQSIGVGQYQHDLPAARLKERLDFVVLKAVNRVGVNVNTASVELLKHISGLTAATAQTLVQYRNENGRFSKREQLKKVPRLGSKSYEQAAGFLRIEDGENWLDRTGIHPESYDTAKRLLKELGIQEEQIGTEACLDVLEKADVKQLAEAVQADAYTVQDIIEVFKHPFRDYRDVCVGPMLRTDVLTLEDLQEGMELEGVVRNVVDFGAFVDIGLKQDALLHISKMSKQRIRHPQEVVQIGDILHVWVDRIDQERKRVQLRLVPRE